MYYEAVGNEDGEVKKIIKFLKVIKEGASNEEIDPDIELGQMLMAEPVKIRPISEFIVGNDNLPSNKVIFKYVFKQCHRAIKTSGLFLRNG